MKQFFKELLEYSHHYNQKLSDIFADQPDNTPEKAVKLFNHLLNAHQIWNNRINAEQPAFGVWELHDTKDLKRIDKINHEHTLKILGKFDLNENCTYKNTRGEIFENSIQNICFHIINHSTYHRGQIASEFRLHGLEPLVTDYIHYKR
ncbi:damage-inducible protein DinB [Echinicola marina]|uniref:DinB family protein n=1 Tax=Echinicola marina TaxID=2859768 RepID=UPI001CF706E2|nr:DinB family protein [Echinicola marina]UCS92144.1 damage-inducible protein DinB [Echinicola marina]